MERTHGGKERRGKRKILRPLCDKRLLHLVIKCKRPIYSECKFVDQTLEATARKFGVPVYDCAVALDHMHFVTKVPSRAAYKKFIRALCSLLAKKFGKDLFSSIFSRIADWGRDYYNLIVYCKKNRDEAWISFDSKTNFKYYRPPKPKFKSGTG